jgi:hypothetical protein
MLYLTPTRKRYSVNSTVCVRNGCTHICIKSITIQIWTINNEKKIDCIQVRILSSIELYTTFSNLMRAEHCLNHLRKSAMCHGDVGIVTYNWGNNSRKPLAKATSHQCIDWDSFKAWTDERAVDMFKPGFLIHPTFGKFICMEISQNHDAKLLIRSGI